jgi:hypothetical protein
LWEEIGYEIRSVRKKKSFSAFTRAFIVLLILIGLISIILWGYSFKWTGFSEYLYSNGQLREEKTLWDWMELLIIPLVLAIGGLIYNHAEQKRNRENISENIQEMTLQQYFDDMTELLIDKGLRQFEVESEKRIVARAKTLMVLRTLNGERKGLLLRFLYEAKLINSESPVISLANADFSKIELSNADLSGANLKEANFRSAQLNGAHLNNANMENIDLNNSVLMGTEIKNANLRKAKLGQSKLMHARLEGSNRFVASTSRWGRFIWSFSNCIGFTRGVSR